MWQETHPSVFTGGCSKTNGRPCPLVLEADLVLCRGGPELLGQKAAVRVMTVSALHQAFVHPVMEMRVDETLPAVAVAQPGESISVA